jgi:hypothetical protein
MVFPAGRRKTKQSAIRERKRILTNTNRGGQPPHNERGDKAMSIQQATAQLEIEGLRIANSGESGWAWVWIAENGTRVCWWVTDEA